MVQDDSETPTPDEQLQPAPVTKNMKRHPLHNRRRFDDLQVQNQQMQGRVPTHSPQPIDSFVQDVIDT